MGIRILQIVLVLSALCFLKCTDPFFYSTVSPMEGIRDDSYKDVNVYSIATGFNSNSYLLTSEKGMILIDAGAPGFHKKILSLMHLLGRKNLNLIIITHGHFDHYGSAYKIREATGAPIIIQESDYRAMASGKTLLGDVRGIGHVVKFWLPWGEFFLHPYHTVADTTFRDSFPLADYGFNGYIIHTPGHTAGSSTIIIKDHLLLAFTGDMVTLTMDKPEPQHFFAHDWNRLAQSIHKLQSIKPWYIYPGHGNRPLIGSELLELRPYLPEFN